VSISLRRLLLWTGFLLLAGLAVYGCLSAGIFRQEVWTSTGLRRLEVLAAVYWAAFLIVTLIGRSWFFPLLVSCGLVWGILATGVRPFAAIFLFLLSCFLLGHLLFRLEFKGGDGMRALLTVLGGVSIWSFLVGLSVYFRVNYAAVYLAAFSVPLVWKPRVTIECLREFVRGVRLPKLSVAEHGALALFGFVALCHWLVVLKPEVSADGLAMHMVIPAYVADHHVWPFDVQNFTWAVMPMAGDWCYTACYLIGGEYAARIVNYSLLLVLAGLVFCVIRQWLSLSASLVLTALFLATPVVQLVTGSLFIENFLAAVLFGGVVALSLFFEDRQPRLLYLCSLLLASAAAAKFGSFAFLAPLSVYVILAMRRAGRAAVVAVLLFVVVALPPYLNAYLRTGNPIFPFLNGVFHSPYFHSSSLIDHPFHAPFRWDTFYDVTFHTARYLQSQDGALGFAYFLFFPLALLSIRRHGPLLLWISLIVAVCSFVLIFRTQPDVRYLYPALPLSVVVIAGCWSVLGNEDRVLYRLTLGLGVGLVIAGIYLLPASGWYHKDFYLWPLDSPGREQYLVAHAPGRKLVAYLNRRHPGSPVLFLVNGQSAGLDGRVFLNAWHDDVFFGRLSQAETPEAAARIVADAGIRYIVTPSLEKMNELPQKPLRAFVEQYTVPEYAVGGYYVARRKSVDGVD
jgi:hypothetical protein